MEFYVFKMNIEPTILLNEKKENTWETYKIQTIPQSLEELFFPKDQGKYLKIEFENIDYSFLDDEIDYLEDETRELLEAYQRIKERYVKNNEIYYEEKFLELNKKCGILRRDLENKYPILKNAHEIYTDNFIQNYYGLDLISSIGTGVTHINKFYKILYYYENHQEDFENSKSKEAAFYDKDAELFYIYSENDKRAKDYSEYIEQNINESKKIGNVTINPVYEDIVIDPSVRKIQYTVTYPNGNTPLRIDEILSQSGANSKTVEYKSTANSNWDITPIVDDINNEGRKGYLEAVDLGKGNILNKIIRKLSKLP